MGPLIAFAFSLRSSRFRFLQAKRGKRAKALGKKVGAGAGGGGGGGGEEGRERKGNACR